MLLLSWMKRFTTRTADKSNGMTHAAGGRALRHGMAGRTPHFSQIRHAAAALPASFSRVSGVEGPWFTGDFLRPSSSAEAVQWHRRSSGVHATATVADEGCQAHRRGSRRR